jgi:hypothetical protein
MLGNYRVAAQLVASRAVLSSTEVVSYVADVRTSQETHLCASTACDRDIITILYVDDVRTSQEAQASTAWYGEIFAFFF